MWQETELSGVLRLLSTWSANRAGDQADFLQMSRSAHGQRQSITDCGNNSQMITKNSSGFVYEKDRCRKLKQNAY